jgi:hypothetical protein
MIDHAKVMYSRDVRMSAAHSMRATYCAAWSHKLEDGIQIQLAARFTI